MFELHDEARWKSMSEEAIGSVCGPKLLVRFKFDYDPLSFLTFLASSYQTGFFAYHFFPQRTLHDHRCLVVVKISLCDHWFKFLRLILYAEGLRICFSISCFLLSQNQLFLEVSWSIYYSFFAAKWCHFSSSLSSDCGFCIS